MCVKTFSLIILTHLARVDPEWNVPLSHCEKSSDSCKGQMFGEIYIIYILLFGA